MANGDSQMEEIQIGVSNALTELTLTEPLGQLRGKFHYAGIKAGRMDIGNDNDRQIPTQR